MDSKKYTKEYILSRIDELSIFQRYLGNIKLKQAYCSPLRKDNNPSFNLFQNKEGSIMYKDHATGESGDVFKFLRLLWNCNVKEVYKRIINDLPSDTPAIQRKRRVAYSEDVEIAIKRRYFCPIDACYWDRFLIKKETLYMYKVYPISYYTSNGIKQLEWTDDDPMYAYKVNDKFKIYRPLTKHKEWKWRGNLSNNNIFGYEQLPKKGNLLIITKSLKDVMVLYELGYTSVAPASESTEIPKETMEELSSRFNRVILFFDNDTAGIKYSTKVSKEYNLQRIQIDPSEAIKDISDFIESRGFEDTKKYMEYLLDGKA